LQNFSSFGQKDSIQSLNFPSAVTLGLFSLLKKLSISGLEVGPNYCRLLSTHKDGGFVFVATESIFLWFEQKLFSGIKQMDSDNISPSVDQTPTSFFDASTADKKRRPNWWRLRGR
jgi:hypothetical protein